MKKTNYNPVDSYVLSLKGMTLICGMIVFAAACKSIKKDWPEYDKVADAFNRFDDSIKKKLESQSPIGSTQINYGKTFLGELNTFQKLPDAQKDKLQEIIEQLKKDTKGIIDNKKE